MVINELFTSLFSGNKENEGYRWEADNEGLNFYVTQCITDKISQGEAGIWVSHQHIALRMLVEQGDAEAIPNGFIVPTEVAVILDEVTQNLFGLPPYWRGNINADIKGTTGRSNFSVTLKVETQEGNYTSSYTLNGPIFQLSTNQKHLLTPAQQVIFTAIKFHLNSDKSEYDNLKLLLALQDAQKAGADINLTHFNKLNIKAPESISIEAEIDDDGNLILTPYMGQDASHEKIQRVLGQLRSNHGKALRVEDEIILFDEKKLSAVHDILKNRKVPREKVKQFLENPTAFIDASLVDLDVGFSVRVHGVTRFKHAYFGETDESGINWFGSPSEISSILPISKLSSYVDDVDKLAQVRTQFEDALKVGADELNFDGKSYDISNKESVSKAIKKIEENLSNHGRHEPDIDESSKGELEYSPEVFVVDVELNDENIDIASPALEKTISQMLYPSKNLKWLNYLRKPYPHQAIGIRWILGLVLAKNKFGGGLLADDMGLGKTFMALSAVDQLYKIYDQTKKTKKPCLVIAPLSVVQNWKDEVEKTFSTSPFNDIVILQSNADLPRYRDTSFVKYPLENGENGIAEIRFTLKIGDKYFDNRLDMPQRLVITTYQTLRDHQFSLCIADWGMVFFDESQNIKNPNTLQTRAAKGLKAEFKLLITGTPVENSLADFWCLMDTACHGYLKSYQEFRLNYITPILRAAGDEIEEVRGQIGRELRLRVGPLMLRREKEDHIEGLPKKTIYVGLEEQDWEYLPSLKANMIGRQLEIYNATLSAQVESDSNMVLCGLQRLRDVSLHPQLADGGQLTVPKNNSLESLMSESGKMQSVLTILDKIKKMNEKCIIFVVNKRLQAFLGLALGQRFGLGPLPIINGDTKAIAKKESVATRKSIINDFEKCKGFNIIIMSPVAAGVGLTIIGANNVIHLERHWNPAKEAQATDRVYRIGQVKDVNIFVPILHHPLHESFDVNLHRLLSKKTLLKDAVVTPEQVIPSPDGFGGCIMEATQRITTDDLHRLSWQQFESLCAELFLRKYEASSCWLTQAGPDYGADVVLVTGESGKIVQCKHTKSAYYEGYKAIQEIYSASVKYSEELGKSIDTRIFATNAKILSAKTRKLAEQYQVQIFSYSEIANLLDKHQITFGMMLKRLDKKRLKIG